ANVGASSDGQVSLTSPQHTVDGPVAAGVQTWLTVPNTTPELQPSIQQLSFATPIEVPSTNRCGRVDYSDMHIATGFGAIVGLSPFPTGCTASPAVSAQQRVWEFLFFDNVRCISFGGN